MPSPSQAVPTTDRLTTAEAAVSRVVTDPTEALRTANAVLAAGSDDEAAAIAARVRGLAAKELGDPPRALRELRRAVRLAERGGHVRRAGEATMSLAVVLADLGRSEAALAATEQAATVLTGVDAARLAAQRGLILQRLGRAEEAFACYRRALPVLSRHEDVLWRTRVLLHRGILHAYLGAHLAAEADLETAVELARAERLDLLHSFALNNLGFARLRVGDIPAALDLCDQSIAIQRQLGMGAAAPRCDQADALMAAGLGSEARQVLAELVAGYERDGFAISAAETRLTLAQAALLDNDPTEALRAARQAHAELIQQRRSAWARRASGLVVTARYAAGERTRELLRDAVKAARGLAAAGWSEEATQCWLLAGRIAWEQGWTGRVRQLLSPVAAGRARGSAQSRAYGWHAQALLRLAAGDPPGADQALRGALRVLAENSAALGATELRAHASVFGEDVAILGVRLALESGRPTRVLAWSERWRAGALRQRPVRPPQDAALAGELAQLRQVVSRIAEKRLTGQASAGLLAERLRLERSVRDRSRLAPGRARSEAVAAARDGDRLDVRTLADRLGERALLELVRAGDRLYAVTVAGGRPQLTELTGYGEALRELESLRFSLNRLARAHGSAALLAAAELARAHAAERLSQLLLGPVRRQLGDRPLVVVPTGALHALPWAALAECVGRPVSVAPSARSWLRTSELAAGSGRLRADDQVVLVAGPELVHAEPEVRAVAGLYQRPSVLVGADATAHRVSLALGGAGLAHVAAHGHFRADNPLFSCLDLADGPLTVYDLERLPATPRLLVFSACDSALSAVRPGDELMGLAASVFALGTSTLVASVTPVSDLDTRLLMTDLHRRLAGGVGVADALAEAQQAGGVSGFVCFGAG